MDQWKKLSGAENWNGLLEPRDKDLENLLSLCIESIEVIPDSVSHHDKRKPAHQEKDLFSEMGKKELEKLYTVTHYIYARSDVPSLVNRIVKDKSAWIGYVAVATDHGKEVLGRRDILICWRGTNSKTEWLKDFECSLISASEIFGKTHNPHVHKGFLSLYKSPNIEPPSYNKWSARQQVLHAVKTLVNKVNYRDEEISITVTGHSLGAALATLSATDIVANKHNRRAGSDKVCMVTAFVFATPKVGDKGFRDVFDQLSELHLLRIKNKLDVVPKLPPFPAYEHVGIKLKIKSYKELLSKLKEGLHFHGLKQHLVGLGRTTRSMFHSYKMSGFEEENQTQRAFGWAASDSLGILHPVYFTRRPNGENDITLKIL
ncbi:phospholipase A1-IIgamma-like isoform X2 [Pistacia vera]|uniref:phospholipase A1-IIgamma-like isoform X2 n=1 Tax=Pistacia vera TaxID=55513 RepID=UPI001263D49D|nr:phospholipase A1-IIgamma-like isoform X2 [Pistacia vera]